MFVVIVNRYGFINLYLFIMHEIQNVFTATQNKQYEPILFNPTSLGIGIVVLH